MTAAHSSQAHRVLVVEDEPDLREALAEYLHMEGMSCRAAGTLAQAEACLRAQAVDVLLLDLGLPDGDGLVWLNRHGLPPETTVIIVSARNSPVSRVSGLRAGAYAYLTKPFLPEEVATMIHNVMRHRAPTQQAPWVLETQAWYLHHPRGQAIKLTHSEHLLMLRLAQTPNAVVSRDELAQVLGNPEPDGDHRRLEVMVRRLRNKAMEVTGEALPIETVHRRGYCFADVIEQKTKVVPVG